MLQQTSKTNRNAFVFCCLVFGACWRLTQQGRASWGDHPWAIRGPIYVPLDAKHAKNNAECSHLLS